MMAEIDGFNNKLVLFKSVLIQNKVTHFKCCQIILNEIGNASFLSFAYHIGEVIFEFGSRFQYFDKIRPTIALFQNPFSLAIENVQPELQLEFCDLIANSVFKNCNKTGINFFLNCTKVFFQFKI